MYSYAYIDYTHQNVFLSMNIISMFVTNDYFLRRNLWLSIVPFCYNIYIDIFHLIFLSGGVGNSHSITTKTRGLGESSGTDSTFAINRRPLVVAERQT